MSVIRIAPHAAQKLLAEGALLVDIRPADEYARCHITQATSIPMEQLQAQKERLQKASSVIFHCRSGNRTELNSHALAACTAGDCYVLEGGLDAWQKAGLAVELDRKQPLELMRQVQIGAGSMVLLGFVLGLSVSPAWHWLSAFVGAGLVVAGVTGFCGLARVLMLMPWNRPRS